MLDDKINLVKLVYNDCEVQVTYVCVGISSLCCLLHCHSIMLKTKTRKYKKKYIIPNLKSIKMYHIFCYKLEKKLFAFHISTLYI